MRRDYTKAHLEWSFTLPPAGSSRRYSAMFRAWHRAGQLGGEVAEFVQDGVAVGDRELRRLNFWIGAGGAWRCSTLPYGDAERALRDVLSGKLTVVPVGPVGGRWSAYAALLPFQRNQAKNL